MRLTTIDCKHWTRLGLGGKCSHADSGQATPSIAYCERRCTVRAALDPNAPKPEPKPRPAKPAPLDGVPEGMVALCLSTCRAMRGFGAREREMVLLPPNFRPRVMIGDKLHVLLPFDLYAGLVESSAR